MPNLVVANLENPWLLLGILLVIFLFFGHKLPQVARSLGSSVSEFKKGVKAGEEEATKEEAAAADKEKQVHEEVKK